MSDELVIQRAQRAQVKLRIALQAVSGGGKTATSLLLAKGMVAELGRRGKLPAHLECHIGVVDTERDSASLYAHLVDFDTIPVGPPYTVERYLKALTMLERAGYSVIIMDQITHEWTGEGGILAQVANARGANDFAKWNGPSQDHERFIDRILNSPAHVICTMRSKTEYALEEKEIKGVMKKVPTRIGLQARQREGTEFEFTTVLDLAAGTNAATCHKDRTELFKVGETIGRMGADWGTRFIEWVYTATRPGAVQAEARAEDQCVAVSEAGVRAIDRCANLPDMEGVFLGSQKAIKAFQPTAGAVVVRRELGRLIEAKDKRKAIFAGPGLADRAPSGEAISADDLINLETLLSDAGVLGADVRAQFGVVRLGALTVAQWDDVIQWVLAKAGERGISLRPIKHTPVVVPEHTPSPVEVCNGITERIANSRGGLFAGPLPTGPVSEMHDDLPWAQGN